jgi:hypothetical protein
VNLVSHPTTAREELVFDTFMIAHISPLGRQPLKANPLDQLWMTITTSLAPSFAHPPERFMP